MNHIDTVPNPFLDVEGATPEAVPTPQVDVLSGKPQAAPVAPKAPAAEPQPATPGIPYRAPHQFNGGADMGGIQYGPLRGEALIKKGLREDGYSLLDKSAAVARVDSPVGNLIPRLRGFRYKPDPNFSVYTSDVWELRKQLPEEYHGQLSEAVSREHFMDLFGQLSQKETDLRVLSSFDSTENNFRMGFQLVEGVGLAAGIATGGVGYLAKGTKIGNTLRNMAASGATMTGYEAVRQFSNYESDPEQLALMGAISTIGSAPFSYLGARQVARLQTAARKEADLMLLEKKAASGQALTEYEEANLRSLREQIKIDREGWLSPTKKTSIDEELKAQNAKRPDFLDDEGLKVVRARPDVTEADLSAIGKKTPYIEGLRRSLAKRAKQQQKEQEITEQGNIARERRGDEPFTQPKETIEDLAGEYTYWRSETGDGWEVGRIVNETADGKLVIRMADRSEIKMDREALPQDAPGHHFEVPEGWVAKSDEIAGFREGQHGLTPDTPAGKIVKQAEEGQLDGQATPDTAFTGIRKDIYAFLNKSKNRVVQEMNRLMVRDGTGHKDVTQTQAFTISEEATQMQRILRGNSNEVYNEALVEVFTIRQVAATSRPAAIEQFNELVSRFRRGDQSVLTDHQDIAQQIQKVNSALSEVYDRMAVAAREAGVAGAENLKESATYLNRVFRQQKARDLVEVFGEDAIVDMLAKAYRHPALTAAQKAAYARVYLKAQMKAEYSNILRDLPLAGRTSDEVRQYLKLNDPHTGKPLFDDTEIDVIIAAHFEEEIAAPGANTIAKNLKFRADFDETTSIQTDKGVLRFTDLLENDPRVLRDDYLRRMTGHVAYAKRGIKSEADWIKTLETAIETQKASGLPLDERFWKEIQWLNDLRGNILGRPMSMQPFNTFTRTMTATRQMGRATMLEQLGLTALSEVRHTLALTSLSAAWRNMPSFRGFINMIRKGYIPNNEMARLVKLKWGFGTEHSAKYFRQMETIDLSVANGRTFAEDLSAQATYHMDNLSGNSTITASTKQFSAMTFITDFGDYARGARKLTDDQRNRIAHQGIPKEHQPLVMEHYKKYVQFEEDGITPETIQWEKWQKEAPETWQEFHTYIERQTRTAIQDGDIGETFTFAHNPVGQVFMELKNFTGTGWGKNMLKNLHYADVQSARVLMFNAVGEALLYATQTSMNYAHDMKELERRLSLDNIARVMVERNPSFSLLPHMVNTGHWAATGTNLIEETSNTNSRNAFIPPTFNLINRVGGGLTDLASGDTSKQAIKNTLSGIPGADLYFLKNLTDIIADKAAGQ